MNYLLTATSITEYLPILGDIGPVFCAARDISNIYFLVSDNTFYSHPSYSSGKVSETFTMAIPKIQICYVIEDRVQHIPVLFLKSALEASIHDWSSQLYMKGNIARCFQ